MQTQEDADWANRLIACTCKIKTTVNSWERIGEACDYCKAWQESLIQQSMEPLERYRDERLKQAYGATEGHGHSED